MNQHHHRADILECNENSDPVDLQGRAMQSERYLHGGFYRARLDVKAMVHSYSVEVMPICVTTAPFQSLAHMACFLGTTPVPVFEIRDVLGPDILMRVKDNMTRAGLAKAPGSRSVVLMRRRGMVVVAPSISLVVFCAVYTQLNATIGTGSSKLGQPTFLNESGAAQFNPTDRRPGRVQENR